MQPISLYSAADQLAPLLDQIDDDGVMSEELGAALAQFEGKGLSVVAYILNCDRTAQMIHEAAEAMDKRAAPIEKRAQRLRQYLAENMKRTGTTELTCAEFFAKLHIERDASVDVFDADQVPKAYMRTAEPKPPVSSPDKKLIAQALKSGLDVPGARIVKADRLEIK